jgi:drug/metabolite transporter (DMT)-like permease
VTLNSPRAAHGAMLLFTALVATSFTIGGIIAPTLVPEALNFLRFVIAAMIFLTIVAASEGLKPPRLPDLARYFTIAALLVVFFVTMFEGLRLTDPLSLGAVFTLVPLMSAFIGKPLLNQAISLRLMAGLAIGATGALWVLFDADLDKLLGFHVSRGEAIFLIGCVSYAAYSPVVRKLHRGESLARLNMSALVCGMALLLVYGGGSIVATDWSAVPWWSYLGIVYLAIFTTAITFYLIKGASLVLPAAKVMAYTYLLPAFVALYEGVLGHGWPNAAVIAGIAITAAAVAIIETGPA